MIRLCERSWLSPTPGTLPADRPTLNKWMKLSGSAADMAWSEIEPLLQKSESGYQINWLTDEIRNAESRSQKARESAKASLKARGIRPITRRANAEQPLSHSPLSYSASTSASASDTTRKRFVKPTVEEAVEYGKKIGLPEAQCKAFIDFYESKGWMVGKTPMVSWGSAMNGWLSRWSSNQVLNLDGKQVVKQGGNGNLSHWQIEQEIKLVKAKLDKLWSTDSCLSEGTYGKRLLTKTGEAKAIPLRTELKRLEEEMA